MKYVTLSLFSLSTLVLGMSVLSAEARSLRFEDGSGYQSTSPGKVETKAGAQNLDRANNTPPGFDQEKIRELTRKALEEARKQAELIRNEDRKAREDYRAREENRGRLGIDGIPEYNNNGWTKDDHPPM